MISTIWFDSILWCWNQLLYRRGDWQLYLEETCQREYFREFIETSSQVRTLVELEIRGRLMVKMFMLILRVCFQALG